jgi:ABC-type antimicrobial peptide transport system permease subunit
VNGLMRQQLGALVPFELPTALGVAGLVLLVALAALLVPARAATRLNVSASLREQ